MKNELQIATLEKIKLINTDSAFTSWAQRVHEWMKQWSVANNYNSVPIVGHDWTPAAKVWRAKLLEQVKFHFSNEVPAWAKESFDPGVHFEFEFYLSQPVVPGKPCDLKQHIYVCDLSDIDRAAENFELEREQQAAKARAELDIENL